MLPAELSSEELLRDISAEMIHLHDSGAGMRLDIHPATAFAVVAMCQLALRHPGTLTNASTDLVKDFIELVRSKFAPYAPAIAEAIRRGDLPQYDEGAAMKAKLTVMRLANMHRVHPQMTTEYSCDRCQEQTGIYPSGQSAIAKYGRENIEIVCDVCAGPDLIGIPAAPGIPEEIKQSVSFDPTKKQ